jgi:hypothetical protein
VTPRRIAAAEQLTLLRDVIQSIDGIKQKKEEHISEAQEQK